MMEAIKRYLPWIIVAAVGLFLIRKLMSQRTVLAPQTQFVETPQTDPLAESRASAFQGLLQLAGLQIQSQAETEQARFGYNLGLKSLETDLAKTNLYALAAERESNLNFLSRSNDQQIQRGAIDRYYSSRDTSTILGSVNQALGALFGNRGGRNIFGTPPTFPSGGGFGGGFY